MMAEPLNIALSGYSFMMKLGFRLISSVNIIYVDTSILIRALLGARMITWQSYQLYSFGSPNSKCFKFLACDFIVNAIGYKK